VASFAHGGAIATSWELLSAHPTADVLGREEIETERRARGFSPACSRSLGRCPNRDAAASSFSAPIWPVVATSDGPPVEGRGKTESLHLGEGPRARGEAWEMVVGRGGNGPRALFLRWEKAAGGRLGAPIYRPRSPV
jgi:hypothetical protein